MNKKPEKRKIYYIGYTDVLKGRVGPIIEMQTCRALAANGHKTVLVVPTVRRPENITREGIWDHYGIRRGAFKVIMLPTFLKDTSSILRTRIAVLITNFFMSLYVLLDALTSPKGEIVIIFLAVIEAIPYLLILAKVRRFKRVTFIYELHDFRDTKWHKFIMKRMDGILCISEALRKKLCTMLPYDDLKTIIGRHGFNSEPYIGKYDIFKLRRKLGLKEKAWIAMYTGKISPALPEIKIMVEAAKKVSDALFVFVGGKPAAVEYWKNYCTTDSIMNAQFVGFIPPKDISKYQLAANAFLLCYTNDLSTREVTSPGKMIEYMYAAKPIVSVDFPVIKEVLRDGENALLIPPDRPDAIAEALRKLIGDESLCVKLGIKAREDAKEYTWEKRAQRFIDLINRVSI
jgi:glycosyltransferase involved in cell wall biosynthesis